MSINFIKAILEVQEVNLVSVNIGLEFQKKFAYFTFIKKLFDKHIEAKKKITIINFDILFYKFIISLKSSNNYNSYSAIYHFFETKNEKENYEKIKDLKDSTFVVIGLDLLNDNYIHRFFKKNKCELNIANYTLLIFSLDSSYKNLNETNENKKQIIKSQLDFYLLEKTSINFQNKNLIYLEIFNLAKLTKDIGILEYLNLNKEYKLPIHKYEFDKINIYLKEYKDLFESSELTMTDNDQVALGIGSNQPSSTFKLILNEKELQSKNEVILPYLKNLRKENEDIRITIDQEELNELYEEDPDGDLDI